MDRRRQVQIGIGVAAAIVVFAAVAVAYKFGQHRTTLAPQPTQAVIAIATATSTPISSPSATPIPECGLTAINRAAQSVVRIDTLTGSLGSGFFIDPSTIVTAQHVVTDVTSVQLQLADGTTAMGIATPSPALDLAVIRTTKPLPVTGLRWRDTSSILSAESVLAIGYPLGTTGSPTLTRGAVSRVYTENGIVYVQTDAGINPGNSGGPLIDECGKVLGMVDLRRTDAEGIAYAISARSAELEINRLSAVSPQPPSLPGGFAIPGAPSVGTPALPSQSTPSSASSDVALGLLAGFCPSLGARIDLVISNAGATPIVQRRIRVSVSSSDGTVLWQNAVQTISLDPGASMRQPTTAVAVSPRVTAKVELLDPPADPTPSNNSVVCSY